MVEKSWVANVDTGGIQESEDIEENEDEELGVTSQGNS